MMVIEKHDDPKNCWEEWPFFVYFIGACWFASSMKNEHENLNPKILMHP
jgi:hypothetical protein